MYIKWYYITVNRPNTLSLERGCQDLHRELAHQPILMKFGMGIGGH